MAVTEGLMRMMNERELTGVLAHELGHVTNRDILISSIAATLAGVIVHVAYMAQWAAMFGGFGSRDDREGGGGTLGLILMAILAPLAASIIQMPISRTPVFAADDTGARMAGDPLALASALRKLGMASERIPLDASPQTAHLSIVNPLSGQSFARLFSTHPPLDEAQAVPVASYSSGLPVQVLGDYEGRWGRRRDTLTARLPVAGTSITMSTLYGRWTVQAFLDDETRPCSPPRRFTIHSK